MWSNQPANSLSSCKTNPGTALSSPLHWPFNEDLSSHDSWDTKMVRVQIWCNLSIYRSSQETATRVHSYWDWRTLELCRWHCRSAHGVWQKIVRDHQSGKLVKLSKSWRIQKLLYRNQHFSAWAHALGCGNTFSAQTSCPCLGTNRSKWLPWLEKLVRECQHASQANPYEVVQKKQPAD